MKRIKKKRNKVNNIYSIDLNNTKKTKSNKEPIDIEKSLSSFRTEYKKIKKLVGSEASDFQSDKANISMLRTMLSMTLDLIPIAQAAYQKNPNNFNASAIVNLTSQAREIANDIRNIQTLEQQVQYITNDIVRSISRELASDIVDEHYRMKTIIDKEIKNESRRDRLKANLEESLRKTGKYISNRTKELNEKISNYLLD